MTNQLNSNSLKFIYIYMAKHDSEKELEKLLQKVLGN